jgi:holo-[acyl-carrier protein] synthase
MGLEGTRRISSKGTAAIGPGIRERKALKALIFGIGTDIIEVWRVGDKLARTKRLKEKVFTPREIEYCEARKMSAQHFAARFSAKEAFLKAMGTGWSGGRKFDEIEVVNDALGKPELFIHGKVKEFCEAHAITGMEVSLSHIKDLAQAVVVLETKSKE